MNAYNESDIQWNQMNLLSFLITYVRTRVEFNNRRNDAINFIELILDIYSSNSIEIWLNC